MPSLSLKIVQDGGAVTRKVKFDSRMTVQDAHKLVKEKVIVPDKGKEYGLFLRSADSSLSGVWLEEDRTLDNYMLRDGDSLDYICRMRNLRVRLLDDTVKTLQVDEAKTVAELMMEICARIGIKNYDEYGLCHEEVEEVEDAKEKDKGTLKRPKDRDVALEQLSRKLNTDDNVAWLDQHRTLREQGVDSKDTLLLKRRLFYSDRNVDSRDPVQLNLLYVQTRDAILVGRHPVTEQQAVQFAGIQCQVQLGDYQEGKHKPGFIENLEEYLPAQYSNAWSIEKKIFKEFALHQGKTPLEAKFLYIKTARAMPTYGVTFFLVKEKQKDKKKLVPRLLGINAEAILRLDEVTKEILQQWPLTHVKTYHAGKSQTFTLNFGDYSDKEYSVKTQHCHRIRDILEGYIDIIRRRMLAPPAHHVGTSMAVLHDNVHTGKGNIIELVSNNPSKIVTESFVGPNKIMPFDQGSAAHSGAQLTTIQQIVVTDHLKNQQYAIKGEFPMRGDMSPDCVAALNKMNANSVNIVGLLTDPTDSNVKEAQKIVQIMHEELPVVEKGVKDTADKQTVDEMQKKMLDDLQDLNSYLNKLSDTCKPELLHSGEAKNAAENIADVTTQMFLSIDPKSRRRSELLRRSRRRIKAGEVRENTVRRESFVAAATTALHAVDTAAALLKEDYTGAPIDEAQRHKLERALEDRMGKLNAAIALYLTAHSDPENIDYAAAINSMNAINELMPKLARDAQMLASTKDPAGRKELLDEMQALFDATKKVCGMTGTGDHEKIQEASNTYADVAGKLIFTFARGTNSDKEKEIIQLAKEAGAKTSKLLVSANELTCQEQSDATSAVDRAGVRTAAAARDLLACAQLTAPAIHEPHCQSALTAAAEGLSSSLHSMETAWKPLLEDPTRQHMSDILHHQAMDVNQALERLRDAYSNVEGASEELLPQQERKRLQFIATMAGAKSKLERVEDGWDKSASSTPSEQQKQESERRLAHSMAQLNAAVAALAAATADRENPDYATAELAMSTISELMPQIVKDSEVVSSDKDEATRAAMRKHIHGLCDATREMCDGDGYPHDQGEATSKFAAATGKLVFLISPVADKGKQKHVLQLSSAAQQQASELTQQARQLVPDEHHAAAELCQRADRADDAARALHAVAQVTSASIDSPRCQDTLNSAVSRLHDTATHLVSTCRDTQADCSGVKDTQQQLEDSLQQLAYICNMGPADTTSSEEVKEKEKRRLQFINSMPAAKRRLDAAAQQLTKPMLCQMMTQEYAVQLEDQLADKLAQLNAAVAALVAATADRENPDYVAAESAVSTITSIMPHLMQDSRKLCGTKTDEEQRAMLQDLRELCDAARDICDNAGKPEGVADAVAKYSAASSNLVFCVTPGADNAKENEVIGLSAESCGKASELLSLVQRLTEQVPDSGAAAELDSRGAHTADAAQALLTVAQATAASIQHGHCKEQLLGAADNLRSSADTLTASCSPHLPQHLELQQQLQASHHQLNDSLDKLVDACNSAQPSTRADAAKTDREKRQLQFVTSLSGAKNRIYDAEQQLQQPLTKQPLNKEDTAVLEQTLSERVTRLNAAVAALAVAKADVNNPDYATAEQSVKEISELMPLIVQDYRKVSGAKTEAERAAVSHELRALCRASRCICESGEQPGPLLNTAEFSKASNKLVFLVSPKRGDPKEQQKLEALQEAHSQAHSHVQQAQRVQVALGPAAPAQLAITGARLLGDAEHMMSVAHMANTSSPSQHSSAVMLAAQKLRGSAAELTASCAPHLQPDAQQQLLASQQHLDDSIERVLMAYRDAASAVMLAAQKLRGSAAELTASCAPHLQPDAQQQLLASQQHLDDSIERVLMAYRDADDVGVVSSPQLQEKQRVQFVNTVAGAKERLDAVDQQLKQPVLCQMMRQEDGVALEHQLSDRMAQLNAAVAALAAATADRKNPDYTAADQAVKTITELMPQLVQDSRKLCGTKTDAEQAAMLQDLRQLCDATRDICDNAGKPEGLTDAATKFSEASGKLLFIVSPKNQSAQAQQVIGLSAASCGKASELLSLVQRLTEQVPDAGAAAELDSRGAHTADAAQALLTVAQATAASVQHPQCRAQLLGAAQTLRKSADTLASACSPHLPQHPDLQEQLHSSHQQLNDSLDDLIRACKAAQKDDVSLSPHQEQQRIKFVSTVSGTKKHLDAAEQQLNKPVICQMMSASDGATLQSQLSRRLALLNTAVAALTAATSDGKNPDYPAAERSVTTITELMPQVVQDCHKLCGIMEPTLQAAAVRQLHEICGAVRDICDGNGHPQKLNEASAKLANASSKLMNIVNPDGKPAKGPKPGVPTRKPAVPARDPKYTVTAGVRASRHADDTKTFLDALRAEESQDKVKIVGIDAKGPVASEEEKRAQKQFLEMIDSAETGLQTAQDGIKQLYNAKSSTVSGPALAAAEVARREQHMEDTLARAAVHVANLVAANYADKLDYKAAMEPTVSLTNAVKSVVDDGSAICDSLPDKARKTFLDDMTGLCHATKSICEAAKSRKEKLNEAAILFGDQSVKLLRVVSSDINPNLEKEVISRAKAIGDTASRLALEASNVATAASTAGTTGDASTTGASPVQDICTAGTRCVDAAGKLVYTAKLIAPTIHHTTSQETLISSADNLSSSLTTFSKTWSPLTSSQQPSVHNLTAEAAHLEELVENLRKDVKNGKLGRSRDFEPVVDVDSVMRQLAVQVLDTAKDMAAHGDLSPELKKEYSGYSGRLEEAIRALDLANARFQRSPRDRNKRNDLEIATQDLQMTLLQTRPSRAGQEQSYIVDFRDFLQDLVKEADALQETARKNESVVGKGPTENIKLLCSKISEDAQRLMSPTDYDQLSGTVMTCADDVMDIDVSGQECEVLVKEINSAIQGIQDPKAKGQLKAKLLALMESCHLLRFATYSHIEATRSAAWDDTLRNLDSFQELHMEPLANAVRKITQQKKTAPGPLCSRRRAGRALVVARSRAARGEPAPLCHALAYAVAASAKPPPPPKDTATDGQQQKTDTGVADTVDEVKRTIFNVADAYNLRSHTQQPIISAKLLEMLEQSKHTPLLSAEDIDKLLLIPEQSVEGTPKQLQDKLYQLSTQLSSLAGTVLRPQSLHATADLALLLANTARALKDTKRPMQSQKIEEAVHEMCTSTYTLLKTAEIVSQNPEHHDMRRKLTDASRQLNESINQLVSSVETGSSSRAALGEVQRSMHLQRSVLQSAPQPTAAMPYAHCLDSLRDQRDVLHKLKSDQSMSREEFFKSMNYVASAISNSTECAAQAAYLLSVSEKDDSIGKLGPVDVGKLQKSVEAAENTCVSVIVARHSEHGQLEEETSILKGQVQDLLDGLDDAINKTKDGELKEKLTECKKDITQCSKDYYCTVQKKPNDKDEILVKILKLMYEVEDAGHVLQDPKLVVTASEVSAETQKQIDEVIKNSLALVSHQEELLKEVKATSEDQKVMTWVMYNKRRDVLDAFENLLKSIQSAGQRVKLLEGSTEDSEGEKKSYVQKQFDAASKWLLKPVSKAEIKTNGQEAVRNLIEVANKITEDLKGSEKEDMRNLVQETEQLLTACTQKYDHEQYSLLMERVRELKKAIERGVVTRVVEDFMEAEAPLADLDLLADYEKDESKRKLILERKIAELLAQLGRVTRTARLIAHTDRSAGSIQLNSCSEQAELLAPMLVKAAQERVASPNDQVIIEKYKSLLAKYTDSLSQIRDLCDQSVDPMEFVQTAGETMERMREESTKHNDPMKCAHTSNAITKLANRVIHVGLSSNEAAGDPELRKLLSEAQLQLSAATPQPGTRASKMPDWKDTTAKILQATETVEAVLGGETIFNTQPGPDQPIYNEALNLHVAIRDWSSRDNEIVAVAKRMAVLMAKLSNYMSNDKQREVLTTSKSIVSESHEVARLANKLAHECTDHRIKTNLLQTCERIPTISGQLKMLTTVKGFSLGRHGTQEDKEALDMLVGNAQSLMLSIQDVVKGAASASVKIMSQRGPRMKWVRKTVY
ncbi:talin-2-like [Helicoverpa zea]|uniref:talin-2-like n=1 Tax=Helicoverpa zea TaxID=7113 RepID=UPI001F58809E|nr:talin-2-like [Helicoverpa zea]